MKNTVVAFFAVIVLLSAYVGCSANHEEKNSVAAMIEEIPAATIATSLTPTPEPTATPIPILIPTKVLTDSSTVYKIYNNGEFGYIGSRNLNDEFKYSQDRYNAVMIRLDTIEAGIPYILDEETYEWYQEIGYKPNYNFVLKNEVDQADYDSKYSEKLKEIQSRYETKDIGKVISIIDYQRAENGYAYLVDTDLQKGIVIAQSNYYDKKLDDVFQHFAANPFEGNRIIDIAIDEYHVYGVTEDGRVLSYLMPDDEEHDFGLTDPLEWIDIIDIASSNYHLIALKKDGTVVASGDDQFGQCDVSGWQDVVAVEAYWSCSFGLKSDGTVVSAGVNQYFKYDVSSWTDIVQIKSSSGLVAGLKKDGTVVATGEDCFAHEYNWDTSRGALFEDIVSIDIASYTGGGATLVAMNSKGEIFYARSMDYVLNYNEFKSGIDDIAAVSDNSFAVLKGEDIIYSSTDVKETTWDNILKNEYRYKSKPIDYNTIGSINKDGALVVEDEYLHVEGVFTYSSKISEFFVLNYLGTKFLLLAENGDAVYVEADYEQNSIVFQSEVLFDHIIENARIKKIFTNSIFDSTLCVYLDDNGGLHYPSLLKEALTDTFEYLDWDIKTNWYRDTKKMISEEPQIAMITDGNGIDDKSYNEFTWMGCKKWAKENGVIANYYRPSEDSNEARIETIKSAIDEGANVIICYGYLFGGIYQQMQRQYPEVMFLGIDIGLADLPDPQPNTALITFKEEQAGFLAGYAAVMDGYKKLAFLGGMDTPAVIRYGYGFVQGANQAAIELGNTDEVSIKYWYSGVFWPTDEIMIKTTKWYTEGTQIIFSAGGNILYSVIASADEANGKLIGVDIDQACVSDRIVTSAKRELENSVKLALSDFLANGGKWSEAFAGTENNLGVAQDCVGLPTDAASWRFSRFTKDQYAIIYNKVKSGEYAVAEEIDDRPVVDIQVDYQN